MEGAHTYTRLHTRSERGDRDVGSLFTSFLLSIGILFFSFVVDIFMVRKLENENERDF